jgi:import inner membrane translocase subunit TIM10
MDIIASQVISDQDRSLPKRAISAATETAASLVVWTTVGADTAVLNRSLLGSSLNMDPLSSAIAAGVHPVDLARREMSFYADLFQKMTDSCFRKCVTRYHDGELQTGEGVCVDRCVFKYMGAVQRIGELLQEGQPAPAMSGATSVPR